MKKIMYGALIIILIGVMGLIVTINTSGNKIFAFDTVDIYEKQEINGDHIKELLITSTSYDVNVVPTDETDISIELSGKAGKQSKDSYKLKVDENKGKLKININSKDKFPIIGFNFIRVNLDVKIPQKLYDSIQINTSSGDIRTEDLEVKDLNMKTSSGDIESFGGKVESILTINTLSGDITANNITADRIAMSTKSGDIEANDNQAQKIQLETTSGDVECTNQIAGELKVDTTSGDIEIDGKEVAGNIIVESTSGDVELDFTTITSVEVDYKSNSGDGQVKINGMEFKENSEHRIIGKIGGGEHNLTIRTTSGDFRLK